MEGAGPGPPPRGGRRLTRVRECGTEEVGEGRGCWGGCRGAAVHRGEMRVGGRCRSACSGCSIVGVGGFLH